MFYDVIPFGLSLGNRKFSWVESCRIKKSKNSNEDIKLLQNFYNIVFSNQNYRFNIENLEIKFKENKYIKKIINFLNSDRQYHCP